MNIPDDPNSHAVPEGARGNPVYEQTRQDMPLWCCGRNCGRNSRFVVLALGLVGIACSIVICLSPNYFTFESLRNDTFYDPQKQQPSPFEYATVANVGMFRYEILEVFVYPWPPGSEGFGGGGGGGGRRDNERERQLFDDLHEREVARLSSTSANGGGGGQKQKRNVMETEENDQTWSVIDMIRRLQGTGDRFGGAGGGNDEGEGETENVFGGGNATDAEGGTGTTNVTLPDFGGNDTSAFLGNGTGTSPPLDNGDIPNVLPGSTGGSSSPTAAPSASPTITNPNDIIAETVQIGVVLPYEEGIGQFDQTFTNGQRGAMLAPILAGIGIFFCLVELCCCTYKCSWLPTALFLYGAFMFQTMTIFLFMTQEFCKYDQDCALGFAGLLSVIALVSYMIAQMLVCCTPRPPPFFNFCKKIKPKKKKKKRRKKDPAADIIDEDEDFDNSDEFEYDGDGDGMFRDQATDDDEYNYDDGNQDYYDDNYDDGYNNQNDYGDGYDAPEAMQDNDDYNSNDGYGDAGDGHNDYYDGNNDGYDGYDGNNDGYEEEYPHQIT